MKRKNAGEFCQDEHTHEHDGDPLCFRETPEIGAVGVSTHKLEGEAPNIVGNDIPGQCSSRLVIAQDKEASYQDNAGHP